MKHTINNQSKSTKQAGIALAVVAFATFGTALSAPPTGEPGFAKADINIATRGEAAGSLNCSWREMCGRDWSSDVCSSDLMTNVQAGHDTELYLASNGGAISGEILLAPEAPHTPGGGHLCTEPLVQAVIAARYCDMSLTDTTNNLEGTTELELFEVLARGVGVSVPTCDEMLNPAP